MGHRIRSARLGRLSVKQLAGVSGVSAGLISEIERGKGNPSFKTLHAIAMALELRIGDLIDPEREPSASGVVRCGQRKRLAIGPDGPVWELLTPNLRGKLELLETTLPHGFSNEADPFRHIGEECVVVQQGRVDISVDECLHTLERGDAITYDANLEHWYRNTSGAPAVVLGAVTPPSF